MAKKEASKIVVERLAKQGIDLDHLKMFYQDQKTRTFGKDFSAFLLDPVNQKYTNKAGCINNASEEKKSTMFADRLASEISEVLGIELTPIVRGTSGVRPSTVNRVHDQANSLDSLLS